MGLDLGWCWLKTGSILVRNGKGGKARTAVIGVKARRALLKWRMKAPDDNGQIFNLTGSGLASAMERISKSSGVKIGCHKCRRSYATMALRSGINLITLQRLLGHSTLDMVRVYIAQVDEDLLQAHRDHSPVDRFLNWSFNDSSLCPNAGWWFDRGSQITRPYWYFSQ